MNADRTLLTDAHWALLAPLLPGRVGRRRGQRRGRRRSQRPVGLCPDGRAGQRRPASGRLARPVAGPGPASAGRHGLRLRRFARPNRRSRRGGRDSAPPQPPAAAPSGPAHLPRPQPGRAAHQPPRAVSTHRHPLRQTRPFLRRVRPATRHHPLAKSRTRPSRFLCGKTQPSKLNPYNSKLPRPANPRLLHPHPAQLLIRRRHQIRLQ